MYMYNKSANMQVNAVLILILLTNAQITEKLKEEHGGQKNAQ